MSAHCCPPNTPQPNQPQPPNYRRALWIALLVNFAMFLVEIISGLHAHAVSLQADSLDFFGDATNYGLSLWVLGMQVSIRAKASLIKAVSMIMFGLWILWTALSHFMSGVIPAPQTMSIIGMLALLANIGVACLLFAYRDGDSNMRSVWLCTRNDAIGNIAVIMAAAGVLATGSAWPDLLVAIMMASLALHAAGQVIIQAQTELKTH